MRRQSAPREGKNSRGRWRPLGGPGNGISWPALPRQPPSACRNAPCGHSGGAGGRSGNLAPPHCGETQKAAGAPSGRPQMAFAAVAPWVAMSRRAVARSGYEVWRAKREKSSKQRARGSRASGRRWGACISRHDRVLEAIGGGRYPRPNGVYPRNPPSFFRREKSLRAPPSGPLPKSARDSIPPTPSASLD